MKNKKTLISIAIVVVVLILIVGVIFVKSRNTSETSQQSSQVQSVITLKPEDVGLKITLRDDQKAVKFSVDKTNDIKHLAWEFSYDADVPKSSDNPDGDPNARVSQGWEGEADITSPGQPYESQFRELGTCSSGHCRYDTGITEVALVLKVTKTDGKIYQINDVLKLTTPE